MTQISSPPKILVLGLCPGVTPPDLASRPELAGMDFIAASRQALAALEEHPAEKTAIAAPLEDVLARLERVCAEGGHAAVLAGGDPLFFGIGATLVGRFGADALDIRPAISVLQVAAAKLGVSWADMVAISLHGRESRLPLGHALLERRPVCLLTDERFKLGSTLAVFKDRGVADYIVHMFGRLGFPEESHSSFRLEDGLDAAMPPSPNLVFLLPDGPTGPGPRLGTPDADYAHEKGLITKWPVRAAALAALRIEPHHCVWDLGAGSGSVAVEAASLARRGRVVAVEKNPEREKYIRENRRRFRVPHLDIVGDSAPLCLGGLPNPDRVFIGGGLGAGPEDGTELIRVVWNRLVPGGRIVISCVLLESLFLCREALRALEARSEVTCLNAAVSTPLGVGGHLAAQNPVFLVVAEK